MKTHDFLLELGTEELPPKLLISLSNSLRDNLVEELKQLGIAIGKVSTFATPRRLAVNISKIKTGNIVDIKSGSLPDNLPNFTHNFDLICLFDVLEHIKEDDRSLKKIYSLLNPNGFIFITVPAHQWLWSEIDELVEHVRRYSKKELKKKIFNAGFELKKISFFNFFLFPLAVLARLTSKLFKKQALGLSIPIKIINDCLYYIFSSEKRFLKRINFPLGLSLICVARKVS